MSEIILDLPTRVMESYDLLTFFRQHIDEIINALDLDTRHLPIRTEILEIGLIEIVPLNDGRFQIEYEYDWDAFSPCKDQRSSGTQSGLLVTGVVRNGHAYFERFVPPPERTTLDEF
jgi:hypothetical protein